jgi:photosystem II stability/assembly factor-like uncharacterized protein
VKQASDGALIAGTNRGIFILDHKGSKWRPSNTIVKADVPVAKPKKGTKAVVKPAATGVLDARINEIDVTPQRWLAATSMGLFTSSNEGKTWIGGPVLGKTDFVSVQSNGEVVVAATRGEVLFSTNSGTSWKQAVLPANVTVIRGVTVTPDVQIMVASREGAFRSSDTGATWQRMLNGLPDRDISSISYDHSSKGLLATSMATSTVFQSNDGGESWKRGPDAGYPLRLISVVRGRFVAATPFDGVIVQP